jgi:hypothetical protein
LPAVYYPSFRLNYFCIENENSRLVITYVAVPKTPDRELTWLQRLVTLGKAPKSSEAVPARTVVDSVVRRRTNAEAPGLDVPADVAHPPPTM